MSTSVQLNKKSLTNLLTNGADILNRYSVLWFLLLLALVYGFVVVKLVTASNAQPTDAAISAGVQSTANTHIDQNVVNQMQSLQDNSVNVKTLFEQARSNPFQE